VLVAKGVDNCGECVGRVRIGEARSEDDAMLGGDLTDITEGGNILEITWLLGEVW